MVKLTIRNLEVMTMHFSPLSYMKTKVSASSGILSFMITFVVFLLFFFFKNQPCFYFICIQNSLW